MSQYIVVKECALPADADWEDPRFAGGVVLQVDDVLVDGQIEPDIVANLLARGVLVRDEDPEIEEARLADAPDVSASDELEEE